MYSLKNGNTLGILLIKKKKDDAVGTFFQSTILRCRYLYTCQISGKYTLSKKAEKTETKVTL